MITNLTSISVYNLCRLNKWVVLLMSLIQFSSQLRRLPNLLRRLVDRLIHFHCFHALFTFLQTCVMELNCLSLLSGSYWQVHHAFSVPYCLWCNCHYCREGMVFISSITLMNLLWIFFLSNRQLLLQFLKIKLRCSNNLFERIFFTGNI